MEIFKNTNFDFLGKKWPFIIASLVLTAAGLVSLIAKGGPRYGIDFRGGGVWQVPVANDVPVAQGREAAGTVLVQMGVEADGSPSGLNVTHLAQIGTLYYFGFFLVIMPLLGLFETPKQLPNSITEAVLAKNKGAHAHPAGVAAAPETRG